MIYEAVLTRVGEALFEQGSLSVTHLAIGDGNGAPVVPDINATVVAGEFDRVPLQWGTEPGAILGGGVEYSSSVHAGKAIRALGLLDAAGNLIAYGNYPDTPVIPSGTIFRNLRLGIQITLANGGTATVVVQSSVVDVLTTSGTWYKPKGAKSVRLILVGGGAGGASGTVVAPGSAANGGRGGGGGGVTEVERPADEFGQTVAVIVGKGGKGGAVSSGSSNPGTIAGDTVFPTRMSGVSYRATGGYTSSTPGKGLFIGGTGGNGGIGASGSAAGYGDGGATGGGGGGGVAADGSFKSGGMAALTAVHHPGNMPGGLNGTKDGEAGRDVVETNYSICIPGLGGGGGAGSALTNGGKGGNGHHGGGGGGGGGALSPHQSGAGGDGGDGVAIVITRL